MTDFHLNSHKKLFDSRRGQWWDFFSLPPLCPDRLWGPLSLLSNEYRGLFPGDKAAGAWSWSLTSEVKKALSYRGVSKSFRTGCLGRELQMIQLSATRCSCIAILWVSLVSFAAITLCVASQRVFVVVSVYFVIDSVRKVLDTPSHTSTPQYVFMAWCLVKHRDNFTFSFFKIGTCRSQ
jgi:hypothetical protein